MNKLQVIERLKLGRVLEAELPRRDNGVRTFLEIGPVIDKRRAAFDIPENGVEPGLSRLVANQDVIQQYTVRICALRPGWETMPNDWDLFVHQQTRVTCITLAELEAYIEREHGIGFESFALPGNTDSPL